MATYYVRPGGSDSNAGTGPATNQAWATIQKALSNTSGLVGGDIVYVAPGHYLEQVTVGITSPSSTVQIIGDVTASQFSGLQPGIVRLSTYTSAGNAAPTITGFVLKGTSKNNLSFSNFIFEGKADTTNLGQSLVTFFTSQNLTFTKCLFSQQGNTSSTVGTACLDLTAPTSVALNATISKCVFESGSIVCSMDGNNVSDTTSVKDSIFFGGRYQLVLSSVQCVIQNCTFSGGYQNSIWQVSGSATFKTQIRNNLFLFCINAMQSSSTTHQDEDYNRIIGAQTARTNVTSGSNSTVVGSSRLSYGYSRMVGLSASDFWSPEQNSPNQGFGTATGAEATDVYSIAWTGATPDAGYQTYSVSSTLTPTYQPTERNASTITIAPGSTSQSIELYLGVTGLTASTSGLSARYNRTRTASVDIPLVARTIAQAWTAGGFAEVDATNMPGVYRLDLPDAALAAGADDVTIVVRGASGTNGAVMTVKLSSGGLTEAQTASAVWGASPSGYNDATTFGGVVNQIDATVTGIDTQVQDVAGNVWDELKANHTIPNSFGDYLDTKVSTGADTSRIQLRQGPFLIKQNAIDSVITEVNQFLSTVPNIEMVLIDSSGGSVSVAGATLVMRVRNQAGTAVVNNVTPTVAYADGGVIRWSPNLSWTALGVTTAGTYRIVVERTMSGVTTTFGPFLVQLSSG